LPDVTVLIASRRSDPEVERRLRPITALAPGQQATLTLRTRFSCPAAPTGLPAGYPHIVIPLRGYPGPAEYPFSYFGTTPPLLPVTFVGRCGPH